MQKSNLLFETSPWFIVLCLLAAGLYTAVAYYKSKVPWSESMNWILATIRFLLVFFLCILLLGPLIRQIINNTEQPTVVIALDNSGSIGEIETVDRQNEIKQSVRQIKSQMEAQDYHAEIKVFDGPLSEEKLDSLTFKNNHSDITDFLTSIETEYESRNLAKVILISDGIYNQGVNPIYKPFGFSLDIIGVGDTIQKPDLILNNLVYNKIAYQGNKFPLVAEFFAIGFEGQSVEIDIFHKGKLVESRSIKINSPLQLIEEQFLINAANKGYQQYSVVLKNKENELSVYNNRKEAFIDVIDGKEKILIVAPAPHPDIKALRSALEENKNYEVHTYIRGIDQEPTEIFDVYVLHQIPDKRNTHGSILDKIKREKLPAWYILGNSSQINRFNELNQLVNISRINNQNDEVFSYVNPSFNIFQINEESDAVVKKYPPVSVPFANFILSANASPLLFQKVGSIETEKPLLLIGEEEQKEAVLIGNGFWQWRLNEYAQNESTVIFDEIVTKTIQFLSAKDDRRKFKLYTLKDEFVDNEPVIFEAEVYNDIYERIYGQEINITIKSEGGVSSAYRYVTSESNSKYRVNELTPGVYQYSGSTILNGKKETVNGSFIVKEMQIEQTHLTANHQLLRTLANDNQGKFYPLDNISDLTKDISVLQAQSIIHSKEDFTNMLHLKWVFFLILLLFSLEWFLRKYHGSY